MSLCHGDKMCEEADVTKGNLVCLIVSGFLVHDRLVPLAIDLW